MIPILYDTNETAFTSNGLGRLRDCISAVVTEERNGIYEFDFEYPVTGANYDLIQVGRIVAVTHDDTGDIEPFDIISYSRPINGVVTFHCVHISYRLSYCTVTGSNINSLADAFTLFETAEPNMPFSFQTDKTSSGYMAAADGKPRTVRELMGGVEGSILDAYGGEYAFNNWTVYLYSARGQARNLTIRYGVNMLDYNEDYDASGTFSSVIPYWTDGTEVVLGDRVDSTGATITGRGETVPLDISDKFESKPTKAQVEAAALSYLNANNTTIPKQTIKIEFVRLQDLGFEWLDNLLTCELCDTINVVFPGYNSTGRFKIVKTVWDVLADRFESMELGELSTTLSEALGITNGLGGGGGSGGGVLDFYPVGSYYETSDTTFNPNVTWGGTWVLETAGQVHVSAGTGYTVAGALTNTTDGGEATHKLETTEIPAHTHGNKSITGTLRPLYWTTQQGKTEGICTVASGNKDRTASSGTNFGTAATTINASHEHSSVGGSGAHNNMQPYIIVNRWHRTA